MIDEEFKSKTEPALLSHAENVWDDHYWNDPESNVMKMRSALYHFHNEMKELERSSVKEVISDAPLAGLGITNSISPLFASTAATVGLATQYDFTNTVMPTAALVLGLLIAGKLVHDKKNISKDYRTISETLANFRMNADEQGYEYAEKKLNKDLNKLNIKLTDIPTVTKEEFDKRGSIYLMDAENFGFMPPKLTTADSAVKASNSLRDIAKSHGKAIGQNLHKRFMIGCLVFSAFLESVKDLGKIGQTTKSVYNAGVSMIVDAKEAKKINHLTDSFKKNHSGNIQKFREHAERPKVKAVSLRAKKNLEKLEQHKLTLDTIEEIRGKQGVDKGSFLLASGLMGLSIGGLSIGVHDLVTNFENFNLLQTLTLAANSMGLLGLGPLQKTAELVIRNHEALHSEKAKAAESDKAIATDGDIRFFDQLAKEQHDKATRQSSTQNLRVRMGHNISHSPHKKPKQPDSSNDIDHDMS